jgi:hypothetical protein
VTRPRCPKVGGSIPLRHAIQFPLEITGLIDNPPARVPVFPISNS